ASFLAFGPVLLVGYGLHVLITFKTTASRLSFVRHALAMAANFPLWIGALYLFCDIFNVAIDVAAPAVTVLIFLWNYLSANWAFTPSAGPVHLAARPTEDRKAGEADELPASQRPAALMVSHYFEEHRGGIEIVADALARQLTERGFHIVRAACGPLNCAAVERRGRVHGLSATNFLEDVLGLPYPIPYPSTYRALWRETQQADLVLVHDAFYITSIIAYFFARIYRKPFLIVQHIGLVPFQNPILRIIMGMAERFITAPML